MAGGAAALPAPEPFIPPGATVVLLAGLPGDLESEASYRQQMHAWLDWLSRLTPAPRRVYILRDGSESFDATLACPVETLPANREAFLLLAGSLRGGSDALLVVAWGHGGMQGTTPVFHVRGPRITASDFAQLARLGPGVESRWVLFFRGSGRFARGLARDGAGIISSERDAPSSSDPIGLPLLLNGLEARPQTSLVEAAEELGRKVEQWYAERRLLRTEEPTLWLPGAEPRRLALSAESGFLSAVPVVPKPEAAPQAEDEPPKREAIPAGLPASWAGIQRVGPEKYPDADAVVLLRRLSFTRGDKPALAADHEDFVQVLSAAGKEAGDFDVTFSPPQEELSVLDAEALLPEGKLVRLTKEEIRESGEAPLEDYPASRRKSFSLPGIVPGAIVHVRYQRQWQTYPMPHVCLRVPLAGDLPILDLALQMSVPKESPVHFAFDQFASALPTVAQTTYGTSYSWSLTNVPPLPQEPLASPAQDPTLLFSTWPDWAAFAAWYGRVCKTADDLTPELSEKARDMTHTNQTDLEKVMTLYNQVAALRYVMVPLGVNSYRPHAAARVWQNQFGDCKDKANLLNTLLHALGFDACLVLVPRFSQAQEAVPGLAFNHAITRVMVGGQPLWLDTTDEICRFGMLPPGDAGRRVLVMDGRSTNLTELPPPVARDHRLELSAQWQWTALDAPAAGSVRARAFGFSDYEFRQEARREKGRRSRTPLLAESWRPACGAFRLRQQEFTPPSSLEDEFTWNAEGEFVGLLSRIGGSSVLRPPFWLPRAWEWGLHERRASLFLNLGYPLMLVQTIEMTLPGGSTVVSLPPMQESVGEPLQWKITWSRTGDRSLRAELRLELARGEVLAAQTAAWQRQFEALLTALGNGASFQPGREQ
jgi:hypothetical protein